MQTTYPPEARTPREIWVLIIAALVVAAGYGLIAPILPQLAKSFDVSVTLATLVVSVFAVFRLGFAPVGGGLVSRFGERPIYVGGLLIVAASALATATANSYWQLLIYRGVGGIGSVFFTVSAAALIVRLSPPTKRGRISSYYGGAFLLGNVIGPILGGTLAGFAIWLPFICYGVALTIAAAIVAIYLRPDPRNRGLTQATPSAMAVSEALRDSAFRAALRSNLANGWMNYGVRVTILPLFAVALLGQDWVAGMALAACAIGDASSILFAGRITDRIGRKSPIIVGLLGVGVVSLAIGFATSTGLLIVLCVLLGVGSGILNPAQQATVADIVGPERSAGKVFAAFMMAADIGAIAGPILVGIVVDYAGYQAGFGLCAVILAGTAIGWLPARETGRVLRNRRG